MGFQSTSYLACMECHDTLFGPFRIGLSSALWMRAYESILEVINDRTETNGYETIDYYEAVRIAYMKSEYMRKHFR